jgi:pimeloyl-ACP methyl ester carboxylesterase
MRSLVTICVALVMSIPVASGGTSGTSPLPDTSPHKARFVTVDQTIKLEVLDWGGSGRPLIFLAAQDETGHEFDAFAPKFTGNHRVYAITRRGYGRSDKPAPTTENYDAYRLGDDVLEVVRALELDRPVLAGASVAGEELSSIGSRYPEKVAGLIYLDAHGPSAFYDAAIGNYGVEMAELLRRLTELSAPSPELDAKRLRELLQMNLLPRFEAQARDVLKILESMPNADPGTSRAPPDPNLPYRAAMNRGQRIFTDIKAPILALAAVPRDYDRNPPPESKESAAADLQYLIRLTDDFEKALPSARVVRLPYANHNIIRSNEADVIREMNAFMRTLH